MRRRKGLPLMSSATLIRRIGRPLRRCPTQKLVDPQAPISLRYFSNRRWLSENMHYKRYHQTCQRCWRPESAAPSTEGALLGKGGYVLISSTPARKDLARRIEGMFETSIQYPENLDLRFRDPCNPKLPWGGHVARMGNKLSLDNRAYPTPVDPTDD